MATFYQDGKSIDYTPVGAVSAGDVVPLDSCIGIAKLDIAAGALGALAVEGVFQVDQADGETWSQGDAVYYDSTAEEFTSDDTGNQYAGFATADGYVKINAGVAPA